MSDAPDMAYEQGRDDERAVIIEWLRSEACFKWLLHNTGGFTRDQASNLSAAIEQGEQRITPDLLSDPVQETEPVSSSEDTLVEKVAMSEFTPMGPGDDCRVFKVHRLGDVSGTSGTGDVALGVIFPDGTTVVQWQTRARSVVVYSSWVDALYALRAPLEVAASTVQDQTGFVFDADPGAIYFSNGDRVVLGDE